MKRLVGAAALLFLLTASLLAATNAAGTPWRFDWPDETATAFFAARIAAGTPVAAEDPDIAALDRRLHPRSVNVVGGALVPAGFLGMPLLIGAVGRVLGMTPTLFLAPLLAALAGLGLFAALKRVLSIRHAGLASVLFLFHPGTWYFAASSFLPNVPFLSLAILSAALTAVSAARRKYQDMLLVCAGALAGLAVGIRLSEALWALPVLLAVLGATTRRPRSLAAWIVGAALALTPTLLLQDMLYGSLLAGYARFTATGAALPTETISGPLAYLLPFGFHPLHAAARLWDSLLAPFWWFSIPALIGIAMAMFAASADPSRKRRRFVIGALIASTAVCGYLALLYGSWTFADPLTMALNTVGRSYVRYWLPIALVMSIAAAAPLSRLEGFPELRVRVVGRVLLGAMIVGSFLAVFILPSESLWKTRGRLIEYKAMAARAGTFVPESGIILTQRLDKVFFPERRVIALEGDLGHDRQAMGLVAAHGKKDYRFYFADALTEDEDVAARSELMKRGIDAHLLTMLRADIRLYELTVRK